MSKHETPMTHWFWQQVGGTLIEEFCAVRGSSSCGQRLLDAVIVKDAPTVRAEQNEIDIEGRDIIVVQTKANRLGMYVMGQALFSAKLMERFKPRSIESVALVAKDDSELRPLLGSFPGMRVVVCQKF
jgi:hypothetical protein